MMTIDLNVDRFSNSDVIQLTHLLQITKLIYYVDELLQQQFFLKPIKPKPSLKIRIPKIMALVFGKKREIDTGVPSLPTSNSKSKKKIKPVSSICPVSHIPNQNCQMQSKPKPRPSSTDLPRVLKKAIISKRVSERCKFKPSILKRKLPPQLEDESAIMDVNDVIPSPSTINVFLLKNHNINPNVLREISPTSITAVDKKQTFQFVMPFSSGLLTDF